MKILLAAGNTKLVSVIVQRDSINQNPNDADIIKIMQQMGLRTQFTYAARQEQAMERIRKAIERHQTYIHFLYETTLKKIMEQDQDQNLLPLGKSFLFAPHLVDVSNRKIILPNNFSQYLVSLNEKVLMPDFIQDKLKENSAIWNPYKDNKK